jgi:hypothetical protein
MNRMELQMTPEWDGGERSKKFFLITLPRSKEVKYAVNSMGLVGDVWNHTTCPICTQALK